MTRQLKVTIEVWANAPDDRLLAFDVERAVQEACAHPGLDRLGCDREFFTSSDGVLVRVTGDNVYRERGVALMPDLRDMSDMERYGYIVSGGVRIFKDGRTELVDEDCPF